MREITPETAADYLRETGRVPATATVAAQALGWGVSNVVLRVAVEGQPPFVLKQARERLRTRAHWVSRLDRIWTEHAALQCLAPLLAPGAVPELLFADHENYLFAMTCAPDDSGRLEGAAPAGCGRSRSRTRRRDLAGHDPCRDVRPPGAFERPARRYGRLRSAPARPVLPDDRPRSPRDRRGRRSPDRTPPGPARACFVHADFSPKNILVHARGLTLVDFETCARGRPGLRPRVRSLPPAAQGRPRHLGRGPRTRRALIDAFLDAYRRPIAALPFDFAALNRRAAAHAAACSLARVDGKSPVDYLDTPRQERRPPVRQDHTPVNRRSSHALLSHSGTGNAL